jgi:aspartate/methionine/tyrosine aminotransferase
MHVAARTSRFQESMIREMTRLAMKHDAINLSQGFPDFNPPEEVIEAAVKAIRDGVNQYTVTWGYPPLRRALAEKYTVQLGWEVNPDVNVAVVCGVTEAITATLLALLDPGDEIIIIEPAHENFRPAAVLAEAVPISVPLEKPDYRIDPERIERAITPRTRALLFNTPHNPTGRVFDAEEVQGIIDLVLRHDLVLITDEIYDQILYDGRVHVSPGSYEAVRDRTVTCGGMGKTYAIRSVHDYMTICAPTPLQAAAVAALALPPSFYEKHLADYHERRDVMMDVLYTLGFQAVRPEGAYYTLADYTNINAPQSDWPADRFAYWLTTEIRVAAVAGTNFYTVPGYGDGSVRFAFPKRIETLREAHARLSRMLE